MNTEREKFANLTTKIRWKKQKCPLKCDAVKNQALHFTSAILHLPEYLSSTDQNIMLKCVPAKISDALITRQALRD